MSLQNKAFNAPLFIIVSVLAFGTGLVIVTASQKSTENRSKASGQNGPYNCSLLCGPPAGSLTSSSCQQCLTAGGTVTLVNGSGCSMDAPPEVSVSCQNCPGDKFYVNTSGRPTCGVDLNVSPTPEPNPWGDCVTRIEATGECVQNYWQFVEERENDWRCKPVFAYLNLCSPAVELPTEPRPEQDPGINPGQE